MLGRVAEADASLSAVLDAPHAPDALRTRALAALAVLRCYQGRGDDARAQLDAGERWAEDADLRCQLAIARAVTLWIDERPRESAACVRRALDLVAHLAADREPGFRARVVARSLLAGAVAQLGQLAEASQLIQLAEASLRVDSDLRASGDLRGIAATIAFAAGRRQEACAALEATLGLFERRGYVPGAGWACAWLGRVLLSLGQRRAGLARIVEARTIAAATGLDAIAQTAERSLAEDVLGPAWLAGHDPGDAAPPVERMRAHLAAAIQAASAGDALRTEHWLARAAPPDDGDHALDRALAELARAVLARATGDLHTAERRITGAAEIAAAGGADPDLMSALFAMVERVRIGDGACDEAGRQRPSMAAHELVIDSREHVVRAAGRTIALGRHALLRAALYSLAAAPARTLGKEALVRAIWSVPYDPLVHDHALKANIHRLRRLLDSAGLRLINEAGAYRLEASGRLVFIQSS